MLCIFPDWFDRVDPDFEFEEDAFSRKGSERYTADLCAHEIFDDPPYDGILVSLGGIVAMSPAMRDTVLKGGNIRKHLRLEGERFKGLIVMGDCGAFSYVNQEKPPYEVDEVIDFYEGLHFDWGVAPDHLVVDQIYEIDSTGQYQLDDTGKQKTRCLTEEEKQERKRITLQNARDFYEKVKEKGYFFTPFASAQGWDVESYQDSVRQILDMGYTHITIGGMARRNTCTIRKVVTGIEQVIREKNLNGQIHLHLLGVGRPDITDLLVQNGITSFDSGSFYRNAWTRETHNYYTPEKGWYAAIRIPQSKRQRMRDAAKEKGVSVETLEQMEQEALDALRAYDQGKMDLESVLAKILRYDTLLFRNGVDGKLEGMYRRTLQDQPWKRCGCKICQESGVEVIIFRGGNRNRRRGFHNLKVFYDKLQAELSKAHA